MTARDRLCTRQHRRISLQLEVAVPVELMTELGRARGVARNVCEGGMLIESVILPPIGSRTEVQIARWDAAVDHRFTLLGDVRHHHHWSFIGPAGRTRGLQAFGLRFLDIPYRYRRWLDEARPDLH